MTEPFLQFQFGLLDAGFEEKWQKGFNVDAHATPTVTIEGIPQYLLQIHAFTSKARSSGHLGDPRASALGGPRAVCWKAP